MVQGNGHNSTSDWMLTMLLLALPIVGFIMLLVWAFGGNKDCRSGFAKAVLIWYLIGIILTIVLALAIPAFFSFLPWVTS